MPSPDHDRQVTGLMSYTNRNLRTGATSSGSLGTFLVFKDKETTVSVRTPNWKKLRPSQRPTNPYSHYRQIITDPRSTFTTYSRPLSGGDTTEWIYSMNARAFGLGEVSPPSMQSDDPTQRAISRIISDITAGKSNLAVTMAEMDKTAVHVAHTATRIYGAIKALKSARFGDFSKAIGVTVDRRQTTKFYSGLRRSIARDGVSFQKFVYKKKFKVSGVRHESHISDFLADTWLEYSYGWKPLLKDVYDLAASTAEVFIERQNVVRTAKGRAHTQRSTTEKERPVNNQVIYTRKCDDEIWVELEVLFRIPNGGLTVANAFGLNNPLEVAWELIPFSFVADWFLPVGDAIRALTAYSGLEFAGGYKSFKHERTFTNSVAGAGDSVIGSELWFNQSGGGTLTNFEYDQGRSVLTSFPSFGWPKLKDPRSFSHATSAIALLQSLFLRGG